MEADKPYEGYWKRMFQPQLPPPPEPKNERFTADDTLERVFLNRFAKAHSLLRDKRKQITASTTTEAWYAYSSDEDGCERLAHYALEASASFLFGQGVALFIRTQGATPCEPLLNLREITLIHDAGIAWLFRYTRER